MSIQNRRAAARGKPTANTTSERPGTSPVHVERLPDGTRRAILHTADLNAVLAAVYPELAVDGGAKQLATWLLAHGREKLQPGQTLDFPSLQRLETDLRQAKVSEEALARAFPQAARDDWTAPERAAARRTLAQQKKALHKAPGPSLRPGAARVSWSAHQAQPNRGKPAATPVHQATGDAPSAAPKARAAAKRASASAAQAAQTPAAQTQAAQTQAAQTPAAQTPAAQTPAAQTPAMEPERAKNRLTQRLRSMLRYAEQPPPVFAAGLLGDAQRHVPAPMRDALMRSFPSMDDLKSFIAGTLTREGLSTARAQDHAAAVAQSLGELFAIDTFLRPLAERIEQQIPANVAPLRVLVDNADTASHLAQALLAEPDSAEAMLRTIGLDVPELAPANLSGTDPDVLANQLQTLAQARINAAEEVLQSLERTGLPNHMDITKLAPSLTVSVLERAKLGFDTSRIQFADPSDPWWRHLLADADPFADLRPQNAGAEALKHHLEAWDQDAAETTKLVGSLFLAATVGATAMSFVPAAAASMMSATALSSSMKPAVILGMVTAAATETGNALDDLGRAHLRGGLTAGTPAFQPLEDSAVAAAGKAAFAVGLAGALGGLWHKLQGQPLKGAWLRVLGQRAARNVANKVIRKAASRRLVRSAASAAQNAATASKQAMAGKLSPLVQKPARLAATTGSEAGQQLTALGLQELFIQALRASTAAPTHTELAVAELRMARRALQDAGVDKSVFTEAMGHHAAEHLTAVERELVLLLVCESYGLGVRELLARGRLHIAVAEILAGIDAAPLADVDPEPPQPGDAGPSEPQ